MDPPDESTLEYLVIGAGFSGVCAGVELLERGVTSFRIYDQASGVGGTWWYNTYPGAACDVPSHLYSFSFEPKADWSRMYATQPEIQRYLEHCVDRYGLRPYLRLGRTVASLHFEEDTALWRAEFADGAVVRARYVIRGSGGLHEPRLPDFPGLESFRGATLHTARWNHEIDFAGKRVAVIGTAASAVQVVPELAKVAAHLDVFQRTPSYVAPRNDFAFSDRQKRWLARVPGLRRLFRLIIFMWLELMLYPIILKQKPRRAQAARVKEHMRELVDRPELHPLLEPDYEMGCKRILVSDDFYPALNLDHVTLVAEPIERVEPEGIVTRDGARHHLDAIVFATGFDLRRHYFSIEVIGRDGLTLEEAWKEKAAAHRGVMIPGFPNYFLTTGPNTGVGTTSVVFMIETTVRWIFECIERAGPGTLVSPRPPAFRAYNEEIQAALQDTVWTSGCDSWYRRPDGVIETLYPYNARTFRKSMRTVRLEELEIEPA